MLKKLALGLALVALAVTALWSGTALAAGPGSKAGYGSEIGGQDIPLDVAAELTGLTEDELLAELEGGKTIPVLLEEMGIDLATFHQAVVEARQAAVDEAVESGTLEPGQAQVMVQEMQECQAGGPQGSCGPEAGDGLMQRAGAGAGPGPGMHSYGEPGEGTGPGEFHRYGPAGQ